MNPEVLILHKPLRNFNPAKVAVVSGVMREYMDARGVALDDERMTQRRPRSLFYSAESHTQLRAADVVWQLRRKNLDTPTEVHTTSIRDVEDTTFDSQFRDTSVTFKTRREIQAELDAEEYQKSLEDAATRVQ